MSETDDYKNRNPLPAGFDETNAIVVSSTQFDTWELCQKKWWFRFVRDMPFIEGNATIFGTILHAVCERYLKADDLGRNPEGQPVDLYPKDWEVHGGTRLNPVEADLIKKLVAKAIEEGILERLPGREIEKDFLRPLVEHEGITVFARGTVDLQVPPDTIYDHKTTKSMKWAKSPAKLADMTQPLLYAWNLLNELAEDGYELPERLHFAHNVFCKDPEEPRVRQTWARVKGEEDDGVTVQAVMDRIELLEQTALQMLEVRQTFTEDKDWRKVPDPPNFAHACGAYGGCPYRPICGGRETPERYRRRLALYQENQEKKMSNVFDQKVAAMKGKIPPASAKAPAINGGPPKPAPKPATAPAAAPKPAPVAAKPPTTATPKPAAAPAPKPLIPNGALSTTGKVTPRPLPTVIATKPPTTAPKPAPAAPKPQTTATKFTVLIDDDQLEWTSAEVQVALNEGRIGAMTGCKAPGGTEWKAVQDFAVFEIPGVPETASTGTEEPIVETELLSGEPTTEELNPAGFEPPAEEAPAAPTPPWAQEGCKACLGSGFNSKGNACAICNSVAGKQGNPQSHLYDLTTDGEGNVAWTLKGEAEPTGASPAAKTPAVTVAKARTAPVAPKPAPVAEEPASEEQADEEGSETANGTEPGAKRGRGRPKKGFTLAINCAVMKAPGKVIDLTETLHHYGQEIAARGGVGSFYELKPFDRRDEVCSSAAKMVEEFGTSFVVANGHSPDLRALVDALRPFASYVIEGGVFVPSEDAVPVAVGG